jgi:hypothetical protein
LRVGLDVAGLADSDWCFWDRHDGGRLDGALPVWDLSGEDLSESPLLLKPYNRPLPQLIRAFVRQDGVKLDHRFSLGARPGGDEIGLEEAAFAVPGVDLVKRNLAREEGAILDVIAKGSRAAAEEGQVPRQRLVIYAKAG